MNREQLLDKCSSHGHVVVDTLLHPSVCMHECTDRGPITTQTTSSSVTHGGPCACLEARLSCFPPAVTHLLSCWQFMPHSHRSFGEIYIRETGCSFHMKLTDTFTHISPPTHICRHAPSYTWLWAHDLLLYCQEWRCSTTLKISRAGTAAKSLHAASLETSAAVTVSRQRITTSKKRSCCPRAHTR